MNQNDGTETFLSLLTPLRVALAFFVWIFLFAIVFYFLAVSPNQGVPFYGGKPVASFGDALYFSAITATTLGYSDVTPIGWTRFLVCMEVFGGLILGGLAVSALTSAPLHKLKRAQAQATGVWLELCTISDEKNPVEYMLCLTFIDADGPAMSIRGENFGLSVRYHEKRFEITVGEPKGTYRGSLLANDFPKMVFDYEIDNVNAHYSGGICVLKFDRDYKRRVCEYESRSYDKKHGNRDTIKGCKVTDPESLKRLSDSQLKGAELKALVSKFFHDRLSEVSKLSDRAETPALRAEENLRRVMP